MKPTRRYKTKTVCKVCSVTVILTDFSPEGKAETAAIIKQRGGWVCYECDNGSALK